MRDGWTRKQRIFIEWLATPRIERTPPRVEDLARQLDVHPATLYRWQNKVGFRDAVNALARDGLYSALPNVYGALIRAAEKESFQHIKLILEMVGEYVETKRSEHTGKDGGPIEIDDSYSDESRANRILAILRRTEQEGD